MTRIVGLSAFGRGGACFLHDGAEVATAAEEWFSRRRHDPALPKQAATWCCAQAGVAPTDVDYFVFAEKPVQRFIRILGRLAQGFPGTIRSFPDTMFTWLGDRLWLKSALVKTLGIDADKLLFVERNLALATSALTSSPFEDACVLVVDRTGEWATTTIADVAHPPDGRAPLKIDVLAEIQHPDSLVFFYDAVAHYLMVPSAGGVRWLAALASHGEPKLLEAMRDIVRGEDGGAFSLDRACFDFGSGGAKFHRRVAERIGAARGDGQPLRFGADGAVGDEARRFGDLARSARDVCIERCRALIAQAAERSSSRRLCLGGALFADPVLLAAVLDDVPFEAVHVDPHLDDVAGAVGAARYATHAVASVARVPAAAGRAFDATVPPAQRCRTRTLAPEALVEEVADALVTGHVVAWAEGVPGASDRPDGHRVLLADPSNADAVAKLRERIKLAEPYVPLAAIGRDVATHGGGDGSGLRAAPLAAGVDADVLRGCLHVDGTILATELDAHALPRLAAVIERFAARSGRPPVLAQTSFNRANEPVVLEAADAVDLLQRSEIDLLVWGDTIVEAEARQPAAEASG